jgi:hypothetical protein
VWIGQKGSPTNVTYSGATNVVIRALTTARTLSANRPRLITESRQASMTSARNK